MSRERITLVVPFVDGLPYLREALTSALALEGEHWELVVSDNTRDPAVRGRAQALVASLADPRVTFRAFDTHVPICASFNRAMGCAHTDLVAMLHADDRIRPEYAEVMGGLAQQYPDASAYYCNTRIIDAQGRPAFSFVDYVKRFLVPRKGDGPTVLHGEAGVLALARGNFIMGPTVLFRRSRLGAERWPEDLHQAADLEYWTRILFGGGTIVGTPDAVYEYRRHAAQNTAVVNKTLFRFREEVQVYDLIAERAQARGWTGPARVARLKLVTRLQLLYEAAGDAVRLRWRSLAAKLSYLASLR
jgi:glycosyltransferase involved in cell wall biosynthesis